MSTTDTLVAPRHRSLEPAAVDHRAATSERDRGVVAKAALHDEDPVTVEEHLGLVEVRGLEVDGPRRSIGPSMST